MVIDKHKDYCVDSYIFRNFITLSLEEKKMVLDWRNKEKIRRWMNHTEVIPLENHLNYIESLKEREDVFYWLVYRSNEPVGVVDILDVNPENGDVETGYYLNPDYLDSGLGFEFYYYFKLFFHDYLMVDRAVGDLLVGNVNSYMLITYFGGHAEKVIRREKGTFLAMVTTKEAFDAVKDGANDLLKFARFIKKNKIDWVDVILKTDNYNKNKTI